MKRTKRVFACLLAVLVTCSLCACVLYPAAATAAVQTYPEYFFWDKAGEDADNGYKAFEVPYGEALKIPPDPERSGFRFVGWMDWNTDTLVELSTQTMDAKGRSFYACWEKVYLFRFFVSDTLLASFEQPAGAALLQPRSPEKEGYSFAGWTPKLPQVTPAQDMDFYAQFAPEQYIATLVADGEVYKEIPYTYGQKSIALPQVPKKAGYTGAWEPYSLVADGVTIHAVYTPNTYIATLVADGEVYKEIPYTYGQKSITLPQVPKKAGYTGAWEPYSLVADGVTIHAVYTVDPAQKTVAGDADGDGSISLKDAVLLVQYIADSCRGSRIYAANTDVNGDGLVNLKDAVLLQRYIAGGWNVVLN